MEKDISKILIDQEVILRRLDRIAERIERDYAEGDELVVVALLNGAFMFMADLLRRLKMPLSIECLRVSSYHGGTESSGTVNFLDRTSPEVSGRKVLLLDDILDSGRTLKAVAEKLTDAGAAEVRSCVLLVKDRPREIEIEADYYCFTIGNEFVVGYGLDYLEKYRNLPYIGVLKDECLLPEHRS